MKVSPYSAWRPHAARNRAQDFIHVGHILFHWSHILGPKVNRFAYFGGGRGIFEFRYVVFTGRKSFFKCIWGMAQDTA